MKKIITSLSLFAAIALSAVVAQAAAPTILVVDMAKLYDSHYKTEEHNAKLRADEQKAQEEIEKMNKDGNVLVEEYKGLSEQANNPSLTDAAKAKAEAEAMCQKLLANTVIENYEIEIA